VVAVAPRAQTRPTIEGAGSVVEELDRTARITAGSREKKNSRLKVYSSSPGGGGGGRTVSLPPMVAPQVIWKSPEFSTDDYRTVPLPANLNTAMRGSNGKGGGTMLRRQWEWKWSEVDKRRL